MTTPEVINYRIDRLEKTNELQTNSISNLVETNIELREKTESLHDSVKKLAHAQKNTEIYTRQLFEESDKRMAASNERIASLEISQIKKESAKSVWKFIFDKLPSVGTFMLLIIVIISTMDLDKLTKLLGK